MRSVGVITALLWRTAGPLEPLAAGGPQPRHGTAPVNHHVFNISDNIKAERREYKSTHKSVGWP